jgi:hypothetical protein
MADEWKIRDIAKRNWKSLELFDVWRLEKRMALMGRRYILKAVIDEAYSD